MPEKQKKKTGLIGATRFKMELFDYGIQVEASDIRAHVSVVNKTIYVFQTRDGIEAIETFSPAIKIAFQPGVRGATATGWPVKIEWIKDVRKVRYHSWPKWSKFSEKMNTSEKGKLAVECVVSAMKLGRFPFWIDAEESNRENVQIKGTDIVVFCRKRIQVKCDWRCGDKPLGTGNVFLQKSERNPLKLT